MALPVPLTRLGFDVGAHVGVHLPGIIGHKVPQSEELAQSLVQVIELLISTLSPFLHMMMLSRCHLLFAIVLVVILCPFIKGLLVRLLPALLIALKNLLTIGHP